MARNSKRWLTMREVLDELGVARSTMDAWRKDGRAPAFRKLANGELRCSTDELDAFMDALELA